MVDFDFYKNSYLGSHIPEKVFAAYALRAQEELCRLKRDYRVICPGEVSEKMALCAMAEALYADRADRGVQSASVGSVTLHYQQEDRSRRLQAELYRRAGIYLTVCRGVGRIV